MPVTTKGVADLIGIPYTYIPQREVVPLWPGWIARRHVTLVVAPGGTGKGMWTVDIAARVSTGRPWPGESQEDTREPEAVVMVTPEDDANEAVAKRLAAAGADTSLVFDLTKLPDGSPFILPDSVPQLRAAIAQIEEMTGRKVGLVVIDPLMACVEKSIASNIAARKATDPLADLASELGPAVILTHHTVKSGAAAGSKGLTDAMRHVLHIDKPAGLEDGPVRVVTVSKSNMAPTDSQLRYVLLGDDGDCHAVYPDDSDTPAVSRGYVIEVPEEAKPEPEVKPLTEPNVPAAFSGKTVKGTWRVVVAKQDSPKPVRVGGDYAEKGDAEKAALAHAGTPLTWKEGDNGSYYAPFIHKGTMAAITVFPNA